MSIEGTADERTPGHYRGEGKLQPFDIIDAWELDFYEGNTVKYLVRWQLKNGVPDLRKAAHYLSKVIERARQGRAGAVAKREIAVSEPSHQEPPRRPALALSASAVVSAFRMTDPAADVIHRLRDWKAAGCVACLLQAEHSLQALAQGAPEGSPLDQMPPAIGAFADMWGELIPELPDNYDCRLTCAEANVAADFFEAVGMPKVADSVIGAHAEYDQEGEEHYGDGEPDGKSSGSEGAG